MLSESKDLSLSDVYSTNMAKYSSTLVGFVIVLLVLLPALVAAESDPVPSQFSAEIGDAFGHTYSVELQGGDLLYVNRSAELTADDSERKSITIHPTAEQWRDFRTSLDAINIWAWASSYGPPRGMAVVDGSGWSLRIRYSAKEVVSEGNNFYPDADGKSARNNPTATFIRLETAIEKLIGGRKFRAATYKE